MGPQLQYLETVLTCEGNFYAPDFCNHLDHLKKKLQQLIAKDTNNLVLKKVEPWNSVRVTFNMPVEAARRLKELAERRDSILRELGILAIQIEGDRVISLTLESKSSDQAEVNVSLPTQSSVTNSNGLDLTGVDQTRHDNQRLLDPSDIVHAVTNIAMQEGFGNSSSARMMPPCDGNLKTPPAVVDAVATPLSRSVDFGSSPIRSTSGSFGQNGATQSGTDLSLLAQQVAINQLSYELQSFQQQFEQQQQQSHFNNDILSQINNGFIMPAGGQIRAGTDVPASLGMLHQTQSASGRVWPRAEDRMPISQNIASSSPLLVNLLKSPGGRHPPPNLMIPPRLLPPELCLSGNLMPPQKRKRSQQRMPKRPKLELASNEIPGSLAMPGAASSSSMVTQFGFLQGTCAAESLVPSASSASGLPGLVPNNPFAMSAAGCSDAQSRHRFMINPYTGDLEEVDDADDVEARLWDVARTSTEINSNSWMSVGQSKPVSSRSTGSPLLSSSMHLPLGLEASAHNLNMTKLASMTSAQNAFAGLQGGLETNLLPVSSRVPTVLVSSALNIPPSVPDASRSSLHLNPAVTSSLSFSLLYSSPSLIASSKPQTISPVLAYSETLGLVPPQVLDRSSSSLHANLLSSTFQHLSSSHASLPFSSSPFQSKPAIASNFPAICSGQSAVDALPPTVSSQLSNYAITSSFHHFYAMAMPASASSIVCPVQSQAPGSALSVIPSSIPPSEAKTTLEMKSVSDATPCVTAGVETLHEQGRHASLDAASALVLGKLQMPKPASVVCSPILSKLPVVTSQGCLSLENTGGIALNQIFSLERLPIVDMAKPTVSDSVVPNTTSVLSLQTPVASSLHVTDVADCQSVTSVSAVEPVNKAVGEAVLHSVKSEGLLAQKVEINNAHDSRPSIAFPVAVLPCSSHQQEIFSLSVALNNSQNGRIPVVSCSSSERGKPDKMDSASDAQDGEATVAYGASGNCIQTVTSEAAKAGDSSSTNTSTSEETVAFKAGEAEVSLHSSVAELVLPPDKVINTPVSSSNPTVSRTSCMSDFLIPSSFPLVLASSGVDTRTLQINQAAALLQVRLHDSMHSHDHMASSKRSALPPGAFTPLGFPRSMDSAMHKTTNDVLPINVLGKAIFATRPVYMTTTTPSAGARPNFSQHHLVSDAFMNIQSSSDALKAAVKPLTVNPLQPVFHGPLDKLHLARESKFLLPIAGGLKNVVSSVAGTENEHSSGALQTEVVSTQGSFEKLGCYLAAKPTMNLQGCMEAEDESTTQKIKFDGAKTAGEGFCGDATVQSIRDSNGTSAIGLQDIIAMLTPADEHQASKIVPSGPTASQLEQSGTVTGIVASDLKTSEVCEGATVADAVRVPPPIPSSFSATAVRFTMFPEAKLMITREPSHRKSSRSTDDSSPRSKATLTVAKLLEKAENAKMSMQPVSKPTELMASLEASFRQSSGPSSLQSFSDSAAAMALAPAEMSAKVVASSPSATRTNFTNISTNCLASKVSISLPTSLSHGFSMMDTNPLPITAPGYPLNLTESVQKVMQGVGLDTSPPPSPKLPPTSSRLSPAKFGGMPITAGQSRSLASHCNMALVSTASESKWRDSAPTHLSKTSRAASNSSIPDSICGDSVLPSDGQPDGGSGQKSESGAALLVESTPIIPEENLPASDAQTGKMLTQSCSVPSPTDKETSDKGVVTKVPSCSDQSMDMSLVCVVDHSYSAQPDPNAKKSVRDMEETLHDSFEDLPDNLNPIDDCHDVEEMFDEITETQVSHFGDKDLFVDGLIYSEGMETFNMLHDVAEGILTVPEIEVEEPVIEEVEEAFPDEVEAVRALEQTEAGTADQIPEEENTEKSAKENLTEVPEKRESDKSTGFVLPVVTWDAENFSDLVVEKSELKLGLKAEVENEATEIKPDEFLWELDSLSAEPVTTFSSPTVDSCKEVTTHVIQPQGEDGTFVISVTSDRNRFESHTKSKEPIRRTRPRKGGRSRERRGGRFVPQAAILGDDGKQEFSTGVGSQDAAFASPRDDFTCKVSGNTIATEMTVAGDTDKPCVTTDSPVTALQSSGRMTTRSRGRKNPRTAENPILPPAGDSSATAEGWLALSDLSPVASKLCENSQRLENPVLLRRSTRTLRKAETVHSGAGNNCDDNTKVPTTPRSRKRQAKDIRTNRSARGGDRSTVVEILDDYEEIIDSFSVLPVTENSQGGKLPGEEGLGVRESKEPAAKKSKT